MNPGAIVIICTRTDSARIPRKALREIAGLPAIAHILARLKVAKNEMVGQSAVFLAVPTGCHDFDYLGDAFNVTIFRGDGNSPLHRMRYLLNCFRVGSPKYVVRITHDDILIDYQSMIDLIKMVDATDSGYGFTPTITEGMGVEVIRTENIVAAAEKNALPVEHLSYYVKGEGLPFPKIIDVPVRESIRRNYRLTMDYPEDAAVLELVLRTLGPLASNDAICAFLDRNAFVLDYNRLPKFSVYTCVKNGGKWLRDGLFSIPIITASGDDVERVIVEDGSTDDTLKEIFRFIKTSGGGIKPRLIVNEKNIGLASSSNIALKNCRGRYVMRLDADDSMMPWALDKMFLKMSETGAAIVYANYTEIDENGNTLRENVDAKEHHHAGCALMDAKLINEIRFRDGLRHWDSLELYNRVKDRFPIAYVTEPLWFYRKRPGSMSSTLTEERQMLFKEVNMVKCGCGATMPKAEIKMHACVWNDLSAEKNNA